MRQLQRVLAIATTAICLHACLCSAATVKSKWSRLKRQIKYGKEGEFKGTFEQGNKLLGEVNALVKEAKAKSPPYARIIDKEARKLRNALRLNKMILQVEKSEQKFNDGYEKALACQEKVKSMEQAQEASKRPFTEEELKTMDKQWESCLRIIKTLRGSIRSLRKNCHRLAGQYGRKWDEYERKLDQLKKIAEEARGDLRMRRQAFRKH
ncbi:MAG: hypothetical protein GXP25_11930 [Planctomycetes bacterium]|nr:hypothetical protein [Planctomycetota bacterium]